MPLSIRIAFFAALSLATSVSRAEDLLWATNDTWPSRISTTSPSVEHGGQWATDTEIADDFQVSGTIERIVIEGRNGSGQPVVTGAYIRFYEWTSNGPGALQSEQFVVEGDPRFVHAPIPGKVEITLPQAFAADGWHFVAVQLTFDSNGGIWKLIKFNEYHPVNEPVWFRDNRTGGTWGYDYFFSEQVIADAGFELWGTPGSAAPVIDSLSHAQLERSGRLVIHGSVWGGEQGNSEVLVDDLPAWITQWSSDRIVAYVPEQANLGSSTVQVVTDAGASNPMPLTILERQPQGNLLWRFAIDSDLVWHRPGLGPDGTIYINDYNKGLLYALTPDGGLKWIADALRGEEGDGSEGPVVVGPDGTVYVGVNPLGPAVELVAFNSSDGSVKWVFTIPEGINWNTGPGIDAQGNLYGAINAGEPFDVFSLDPNGNVRWTSEADPFVFTEGGLGTEMVFGRSTSSGPIDQLIFQADWHSGGQLYAFDMADGAQKFALNVVGQSQLQPDVNQQTGAIVITEFLASGAGWGLQQFDSAGAREWRFDPGIASGISGPDVSSNGNSYVSWDGSRLSAVDNDGIEIWRHIDSGMLSAPIASPDGQTLVVGGQPTFGVPGFFKAFDAATGNELFRIDLSNENGGHLAPQSRAIFSHNGSAAYATASIVGDPQDTTYSYLYAISVGEPTTTVETTLTKLWYNWGTRIAGFRPSLRNEDERYLQMGSEVANNGQKWTQITVQAEGPVTSVARLDLSTVTRVNLPNVTTRTFLYNWDTNKWVLIDSVGAQMSDTRREYLDIANANAFVRDSDGAVQVRLRFSNLTDHFEAFMDLVQVDVTY